MSTNRWRLVLGVALILAGILALINSLPGIELDELIWAAAFFLAGLIFLLLLIFDRRQWWAPIPGFTLMGIGVLMGLEELAPSTASQWGE